MRRGVGAAGLRKKKQERERKAQLGSKLEDENLAHIGAQISTFKTNLEAFASKYKTQINSDPVFRAQFAKMCTSIGVDPLASNKGFWAELLGVGDFYYELGVQIIDVCLATRAQNGGIVGADELQAVLQRRRPAGAQPVSVDDILRAVEKLKGLGSGFNVMQAGSRTLIVSVPMALSDDHGALLSLAQEHGEPRGTLDAALVERQAEGAARRRARRRGVRRRARMRRPPRPPARRPRRRR